MEEMSSPPVACLLFWRVGYMKYSADTDIKSVVKTLVRCRDHIQVVSRPVFTKNQALVVVEKADPESPHDMQEQQQQPQPQPHLTCV